MNNKDFVNIITKNTYISKIIDGNTKQLLFWLKKIPIIEETDVKMSLNKLLKTYTYIYLSDTMIKCWADKFPGKNSFKSINITFL